MLDQDLSNSLWDILKTRPEGNRLHSFSAEVQGAGVRVETFTVRVKLKGGRIETRRNYYRMVRDATGTVLYDQLDDVPKGFVDEMDTTGLAIPDVRISPEHANKCLRAVLGQQEEVDRLIATNGG